MNDVDPTNAPERLSDRYERVTDIFLRACDLDENARKQYLDEACGDDSALRHDVERMLAQDGGSLSDTGSSDGVADAEIDLREARQVGRYKLLQRIGEGGMGVVYMAQQDEPVQRKVALKIIKLGMDTKEVVARFEAEQQALAMMDHPNIARVLDAGTTDTGRPYFVMELVQGIPITEFCERNKLPTDQRLELFVAVCQAIQSAHQKGIIHRDIKPSNVLVTLHHGDPMPKVIDFGVAKATNQKLTEKTYFTRYASMIGTPAYMSPEQAEMSSMDVDTRSDVYSLGVLLYELLTGTTPFPAERLRSVGYGEMQRIIAEDEPERPSTRVSTIHEQQNAAPSAHDVALKRELKGELDWIALKCLEKDRRRRYDTANELAADVRRYLNEEPVVAVAPTLAYQLQKLYQRNKTVMRLSALLFVTLLLGFSGAMWQWRAAVSARRTAETRRDDANRKTVEAEHATKRSRREERKARAAQRQTAAALYNSNIARARLEIQANNAGGAAAILNRCPADLRGWEWHLLQQRLQADLFTLEGHTSWVYDVECSADGRWIASAGGGNPTWNSEAGRPSGPGEVIVWAANTGQRIHTLNGHEHVIENVAFSADSKTLASASQDRSVRLWDVVTGEQLKAFTDDHGFASVAFSPDGRYLAAGGASGDCWLWDLGSDERHNVLDHRGRVRAVSFSPDSKSLYSLSWGKTTGTSFQIWDLASWSRREFENDYVYGDALGVHPDGHLVAASASTSVTFWDTQTGRVDRTVDAQIGRVEDVVFNPDGSGQFATCSVDSTIRVWKGPIAPVFGDPDYCTLLGHTGRVLALDYTPDGNRLVSGGSDGTVRVWDLSRKPEHADVPILSPSFPNSSLESIAFDSESNQLSIAGMDGRVVAVDIWEHAPQFRAHVPATARRSDPHFQVHLGETIHLDALGNTLVGVSALSGDRSIVKCWELPSGVERAELGGHTVAVEHVTSNRGATRVATASAVKGALGQPAEFKVWDGKTAAVLFERAEDGLGVTRIALSPNGDRLAVACTRESRSGKTLDSQIRVFDIASGKEIATYTAVQEVWSAIAFDGEGRRLAAAGADRTILIWDLQDGAQTTSKQGLPTARDLAFSPDGQRLAVVSKEQTKVLHAEFADELLMLRSYAQRSADTQDVNPRVCWSHDSRSLAVSSRRVSVWSIGTPEPEAETREARTQSATRRATSHRLHMAHWRAVINNLDDASQEVLAIVDAPLNSPLEYRMRALVFEKVGEHDRAADDRAAAGQLED